MKNRFVIIVLVMTAVMLAASFTFAADTKAPAKPGAQEAVIDIKVPKKELVDINSASDAELKTIPGISDALAAKIVVNRPYANKTQLKSRKIVPDSLYEKIKELIIAKKPKK